MPAQRPHEWIEVNQHVYFLGFRIAKIKGYIHVDALRGMGDLLTRTSWDRLRGIVQRRDGGKCQYCGAQVGAKGTVDHIIPLALGGTDSLANLAWACRSCNQRKGDRLPDGWEVEDGRT